MPITATGVAVTSRNAGLPVLVELMAVGQGPWDVRQARHRRVKSALAHADTSGV